MRCPWIGALVCVVVLSACSGEGETCDDGIDNDGNGQTDCADSACPAGAACGPNGAVCGADRECGTCSGNGGPAEPSGERSCSDGFDNDCDGGVDCGDAGCAGKPCTTLTGAAGACTSGACVCTASDDHESACGDGLDQDCDGLVDCADRDCQPVGNGRGEVCDALGNTCSVDAGLGSTCSVCAGNGGRPEGSEVSCGDGHDNDCDGIADCQDPDCAGVACNPDGATCDGSTRLCACGRSEPDGERTCGNGQDDDCDGLIDCADDDCQPLGAPGGQCAADGRRCGSDGTCACDGKGGLPESKETRCADGFDNDCDGLIDCVDPDCRAQPGKLYGASCDQVGTVGMVCNTSGACVCGATGEAVPSPELRCDNGVDDDCDGFPDCLDDTCRGAGPLPGRGCDPQGHLCDGSGTCSLCSGNGGEVQTQESNCMDVADNDCDGLVDCEDPSCLGQGCSAGNPAFQCLVAGDGATRCVDLGSGYSVVVEADRTRLPADGVASAEVTVRFAGPQGPVGGADCTFSADPDGALFDGMAGPVALATGVDGVARVAFGTTDVAGTYRVTATCTTLAPGGALVSASGSVSIELPSLWVLRVASVQYPVMGSRFSGFQEQGAIVFEALDTAGRPYPAGLEVTFTHAQQGGSFIGLSDATCAGVPPSCSASAWTDEEGRATVSLASGMRFALLSVRAQAFAGGLSTTALADDIAVVGAKPNGAHMGIDCRPWNVPALTEHDCSASMYAGPGTIVDCTLTVADRHGIVVGFPTLAAFWSEAGAAGLPIVTVPYDPDKPSDQQRDIGRALGYVSVLGQPLPWDVVPDLDAGEHSYADDFGCGFREANPRDGLVTVIALVAGEEGYVDRNSNGRYDADEGEPFIDIGEPFLDVDDNGRYDAFEPFQDVDDDGAWTPPNGQWDADTVLWTQTRIVYTGQPLYGDIGGQHVYSRLYEGGTLPPTLTGPVTPFADDRTYGVYFTDENFNPLSGLTSYEASTATGNASAKLLNAPSPGGAEPLGAFFRLLYCGDEDGASCAYGPAASACTTAPCYVVPDVGSFSYGTYFDLAVKCEQAGPDQAFASATLNGVRSTLSVSGTCPEEVPDP